MPAAILDVDLDSLPSELCLDGRHSEALVLVRFRGRPIGQARLPAERGRVLAPDVHQTLARACGWTYWEQRLGAALGITHDGFPEHGRPRCTVAVCTRDRPNDLRGCLAALSALPDDGQEVLVVDNAPTTDETLKVVEDFAGVLYAREDRPGLDVARNRALREARGDVVAFTDDDAMPDKGWLRGLARNFEDPLVLCAAGLTMPAELDTDAQDSFERESSFGRGFARRVFDAATHDPHHSAPMGAGVNMAVRRSILARLGGFDEALDAGTPTRSGGDRDLFTRVLAAGYRVVYDPAALVWHRHRRDPRALRSAIQGYGTGVYAALTKSLLVDGELKAPLLAWGWFRHNQLPALFGSLLRRPRRRSLRLILAELWGCALGPWAYLISRSRTVRE
jgi:GT2 family glycosyltransferase